MTINVGIKENQKEEINMVLRSGKKYNSINEFVQRATDELLSKEVNEEKNKSDIKKVLLKIESFLNGILEKELEEKVIIPYEMLMMIERILDRFRAFERYLRIGGKTGILVAAIKLKDTLNKFKEDMGDIKDNTGKKHVKTLTDDLDKLKTDFTIQVKIYQEKKSR